MIMLDVLMRIKYFESDFQGYSSEDSTTASVIDRCNSGNIEQNSTFPATDFLINAAFFPNQQSSALLIRYMSGICSCIFMMKREMDMVKL